MTWKKLYIIIISFSFFVNVQAQNEANIWYFGVHAGLDFNNGEPTALLDGRINSSESSATIADANGNLLFYTDGINVWNRNHNLMLNGLGLNGNLSTTQGAIIIPKPNSSNIYYIFTLDQAGGPNGLQYSEVDMTLDNGLGGVTSNKNIFLTSPIGEKITATISDSFNGYWVVVHKLLTNEFLAYQVNSSGVNTTPVSSIVGPLINDNIGLGQMKFSPDGNRIAMANSLRELMVYDFNKTTGKLSNPKIIIPPNENNDSFYGVEFSQNSQVLYASGRDEIVQFNLNFQSEEDIGNSQIVLHNDSASNIRNYFALQLGPNGKIYLIFRGKQNLSVIENPNIIGIGCNFTEGAVSLGDGISVFGFPSFIQSNFRIGGIQYDGTCLGDATSFSINSTFDNILWNFGDPASGSENNSTEISPSHIFSSPGVYNVTANISIDDMVITKTISVTIYETIAHQPPDIVLCDDDSNDGFETVDLSIQNSSILNGQDPELNLITYHLTLEDAQNGEEVISTNFVTTENPKTIYARVENVNAPDCYSTTSFQIMINEQPVLAMEDQLTICGNETLEIVANPGYDEYLWSTGETSESISVSEAGNYEITVANTLDGLRCETSQIINVVESSDAVITNIQIDDFTLNDNRIVVFVEGDGDYEFSLDGIDYRDNNQFTNLPINEYTVYVRDKNGCGDIVTEQVFLVYYPNFFTPNGDGYNDTWQLTNGSRETNNTISIFNRYGKLVKQLSGNDLTWDGTYNGNPVPSGTYWFTLNRQNGKQYKGHFMLKRQ